MKFKQSALALLGISFLLGCGWPIKTVHKPLPPQNQKPSPITQAPEIKKETLLEPLYYSSIDKGFSKIMDQMKAGTVPPHLIQKDFQRWVRIKRKEIKTQKTQIRKEFSRANKLRRTEHLNKWHRERQEFKDSQPNREALKRFYHRQDLEKKEFFALEKERANTFRLKSKEEFNDLNNLIRERYKAFRDEFKVYRQRYKAVQKLPQPVTSPPTSNTPPPRQVDLNSSDSN